MPPPLLARRAFLSGRSRLKSGSRICDRYANVSLTDQFGERFRFRSRFVDGRALIINTMYTVCRGTCPGTLAVMKELREQLEPVFGDRMSFVSVTLDPQHDTPEILRDFSHIYGADKRRAQGINWCFVTGAALDIDELRISLDFYDLDPRVDSDISQHGTLLLFGNTSNDRWAALPSEMRLPLLTEAIRRICGFTFEQRYGIPG